MTWVALSPLIAWLIWETTTRINTDRKQAHT